YVNTEGRVQRARMAHAPLGDAKEDWKILRAFSETIGKTLPYNSIDDVRANMALVNPVFETIDEIVAAPWDAFGTAGSPESSMNNDDFAIPVDNFYMTDPISRSSITMAQCTELLSAKKTKTGTDG
ncbi:MAG: molybdopterin-dependent oxidoreductase, partial [Rhodospirillales bacterium]|nr:molybdopterin-dependent oxidoreductase [Rhodospirillales bacterium]